MRDLKAHVAWITGAGSGIGEATACALAALGMKVVLSGRRESALKRVATRIRDAEGHAEVAVVDVTNPARVSKVVEDIHRRYQRLDMLVCSAGANSDNRYWSNSSAADWDKLIQVNLNAAFYCAKAVLPVMKQQQDGLIVNISSWSGKHVSAITGPAYTAAKHALTAMSETLNMEACTYGVRCCCVAPGEVSTPLFDDRPIPVSPQDREKMLKPEDVANCISFIATLPRHVCVNDITVSPTWNRTYVPMSKKLSRMTQH